MSIKTYPEMNETVKDLLRLSEEPMDLYVLTRIEELEKQVADLTPPPNDPLTLDELREMDGEPVYDDLEDRWLVIEDVNYYDELYSQIVMADGTVFDTDEDGARHFLGRLYRRKPEEGT